MACGPAANQFQREIALNRLPSIGIGCLERSEKRGLDFYGPSERSSPLFFERS